MGHSDYSILVKTYGRRMATESSQEPICIWLEMEKLGHNAPIMPQKTPPITELTEINDYKRPKQTHPHDATVSPDQTATSGASGFLPDG